MAVIRMTKKGNVRVDGVKYKAVNAPSGLACVGCALRPITCTGANCMPGDRPDGRNVIFVRKENHEHR